MLPKGLLGSPRPVIMPDPPRGIITNGLVLNLDAGQVDSYPGSGINWADLSGNRNNATLINGPVYSNVNGGFIAFDGTNDYASCRIPALFNYTLSFWLYIISLPAMGERQIFGAPSDIAGISVLNSSGWKWHSWGGGLGGRLGTPVVTGVWYNFIMIGTGSTTSFYVNNRLSSTFGNKANINSGTGYFCDVIPSGGRNLNANISNISFYDCALSAAEISQNFNALRDRFGI